MPFPRSISWSVLLLALVYPTILTWTYFVQLSGQEAWLQRTVYGFGKTLQFTLPVVWAFAVLGAKPQWRAPHARELAWGFAVGLLVMAGMCGLYLALKPQGVFDAAAEQVRAKIVDMRLQSVALYAAMGIFYSLIHSLLEEVYWRWFVYGGLRDRLPIVPSVIVSSLGFMAHHVIVLGIFFGWSSPLTYLFSLGVAAGGAIWAGLYERMHGLYGPWLSHLLVDAAIFLIGFDMVRSILQ
jgi:membrane protease YdiL (CAAX protease family)